MEGQNQSQNENQNQKRSCTVLLFGPLQTYCDETSSLALPAPTKLITVFGELERRFPGVNQRVLRSCQVVVGLEYIDVDVVGLVDWVLTARPRTVNDDHDRVKWNQSGDERESGNREGDLDVDSQRQRKEEEEVKGGEREIEGLNFVISPGDEVGIIPPVSSG